MIEINRIGLNNEIKESFLFDRTANIEYLIETFLEFYIKIGGKQPLDVSSLNHYYSAGYSHSTKEFIIEKDGEVIVSLPDIQSPYKEGKQARENGESIQCNPYRDTEEFYFYSQWVEGWMSSENNKR